MMQAAGKGKAVVSDGVKQAVEKATNVGRGNGIDDAPGAKYDDSQVTAPMLAPPPPPPPPATPRRRARRPDGGRYPNSSRNTILPPPGTLNLI